MNTIKKILAATVLLVTVTLAFAESNTAIFMKLKESDFSSNEVLAARVSEEIKNAAATGNAVSFNTPKEFEKAFKKHKKDSFCLVIPVGSELRQGDESSAKMGMKQVHSFFSDIFSIVTGNPYNFETALANPLGYNNAEIYGAIMDSEEPIVIHFYLRNKQYFVVSSGIEQRKVYRVRKEEEDKYKSIEEGENVKRGYGRVSDFERNRLLANRYEKQRDANEKAGFGRINDIQKACATLGYELETAESLLKKAKEFEAKKQWIHAFGTYQKIVKCSDIFPASSAIYAEAKKKYFTIYQAIKSGLPGLDSYDEFSIYDAWIELLKETEKYTSEQFVYDFAIEKLQKNADKTDMATRTFTYETNVSWLVPGKYSKNSDIFYAILEGLEKARKSSWTDIPKDWPNVTILEPHVTYGEEIGPLTRYNERNNVEFLRDGVVLTESFKTKLDDGDFYKVGMALAASGGGGNSLTALGHAMTAEKFVNEENKKGSKWLVSPLHCATIKPKFEFSVNLVDEKGNAVMVTEGSFQGLSESISDRVLKKLPISFSGITSAQAKLIEEGKLFVVISEVRVKYGSNGSKEFKMPMENVIVRYVEKEAR